MVGGIRDVVLFGEWKLLLGFIAILVSALIGNMILGYFNPGFAGQPVAHTDGLWNALGMALAGFGCVLLEAARFVSWFWLVKETQTPPSQYLV